MVDPEIILRAPVEIEGEKYSGPESEFYADLVARLQSENEALRAELAAEKGEGNIRKIKAEMMRPFADKVFKFVCAYCGLVSIIIVLAGFEDNHFHLSDAVLTVIAGSTAVSVIGLVTIVLSGLFRTK